MRNSKSVVAVPAVEVVRNRPIAKFLYQGSHSKPVRRSVILTEVGRNTVSGYEVREGNTTRLITKGKYKTFSRDLIQDWTRHNLTESF